MKLKLFPQTLPILEAFLEHPADWKYGYDISRLTGLKPGTLHPIPMRQADRACWRRSGRQVSRARLSGI